MALDAAARLWFLWLRAVKRRRVVVRNAWWALPSWTVIFVACLVVFVRSSVSSVPKSSVPPFDANPLLDDEQLHRLWNGRHFIFCASTGRAGSMYMRALLRTARDTIALHEPEPKMTDGILRSVIVDGRRAESFEERALLKLSGIHRLLSGSAPSVNYAETSHMFIKTYSDVVLKRIAPCVRNVTIVVLHRDLGDVIQSQFRLGWYGDGHSGYKVWYYGAGDVHPTEQVISGVQATVKPNTESQARLESLFGYNADIAGRIKTLEASIMQEQSRGLLRNVKVVHFRLDSQEEQREAQERAAVFLRRIGLDVDDGRLSLLHTQNANARDDKKDRLGSEYISSADIQAFVTAKMSQEPYRNLFA